MHNQASNISSQQQITATSKSCYRQLPMVGIVQRLQQLLLVIDPAKIFRPTWDSHGIKGLKVSIFNNLNG
jgi:hypothetical protein